MAGWTYISSASRNTTKMKSVKLCKIPGQSKWKTWTHYINKDVEDENKLTSGKYLSRGTPETNSNHSTPRGSVIGGTGTCIDRSGGWV